LGDRLLVTTSHSLLKVDVDARSVEPIHRGDGLYFGIATDGERWFVAARGRMVSSTIPHEQERGGILVFDRALRPVGRLEPGFAMRDLHEILWQWGKLWITCSYDNMVATYEPATGRWSEWFPLGRVPSPPYDANHLNSLAALDGRLWMIAHNRGPSELLEFDPASLELASRRPLGVQAHNIRRLPGGAIFTCSSDEGGLAGLDGWRLPVGGFTRGIHLGESARYVGISEIAERRDRDLTTGRIAIFDLDWRLQDSLELPGEGLLLDIHPLP
jgi:hypothetical protein